MNPQTVRDLTGLRAPGLSSSVPAGERLPEVPAALPTIEIPEFGLKEFAPLAAALGIPQLSPAPLPMEALGQGYGMVLYRTRLQEAGQGTLQPMELRDYARVYVNGREMAVLDRSRGEVTAEITAGAGDRLELLVENMGRINFGSKLADNQQGITDRVLWNGTQLSDWEMYPLPLQEVSRLPFAARAAAGAGFYRGGFNLAKAGDTFLDMSGWDMGCVWVNGHNLGRFWRRGPQQSLFLPGCWLRRGRNEVIVFDYTPHASPRISASPEPRFGQA